MSIKLKLFEIIKTMSLLLRIVEVTKNLDVNSAGGSSYIYTVI